MTHPYFGIAFTDAVKAEQVRYRSRARTHGYDALPHQAAREPAQPLDELAAGFIAERDEFYWASVSETGWPYLQFRGGPAGFVKVLSPRLIGWADFVGNGQHISVGNVAENDRVALFFMDYVHQARLKLYGRAVVEDVRADPLRQARFDVPQYVALVERVVTIRVVAYDWNCPRHITPRYTAREVGARLSVGHREPDC